MYLILIDDKFNLEKNDMLKIGEHLKAQQEKNGPARWKTCIHWHH